MEKGWLRFSVAAALGLLALVVLDARAETPTTSTPYPLAKALAERNNRFGLELMAKLHKDGANLFLSPFSIASALQMTSGAAAGQTLAELLRTMHVDDLELPEANRALIDLSLAHAEGALALANSLWGNAEIVQLNEGFAAECRKDYSAEVRALRFADPRTLLTINGWIKERTAGKITELLDRIPKDAAGYLISAVHFKDAWHKAFDRAQTQEADFMLLGGQRKKVKMMNATDDYPYVETGEYQGVGLGFGPRRHPVMWFIVPAPGKRLSDVLGVLDAEKLKEIAAAPQRRGHVSIPRFTLRYKSELSDALQNLGIVQAFDARTADFSQFASNKGRFVLSRVLHEAVLEVDEKGAEAAAATAVEAVPTSVAVGHEEPFTFVANQPFFVAIIDAGTPTGEGSGALLFAGSIYDPESQ
jgi:serpin B